MNNFVTAGSIKISEKSKTPKVPEKEDYEDDYLDEDFEKGDLQPELFAPT